MKIKKDKIQEVLGALKKKDNDKKEIDERIDTFVNGKYIDLTVDMEIDTKTVVDFLSKKGYEDTEDNIQTLAYLAVGEGIEDIRDNTEEYLKRAFREAESYLE